MKNSKEQSENSSAPAKDEYVPDKSAMKDAKGGYITQGLFLELGYETKFAIYTLTDQDKCYDGKKYISLRRLYLEMADPTEYNFATKYLWGWEHWQRMVANRMIAEHVDKWRDELEVKLRAEAINALIKQSGGNFNAAKWVADGHWNVKRGRPSKAEKEKEKAMRERIAKEAESDSDRIVHLVRKEDNGTH